FNGINLRGIDVARLYTESRANPKLTIPEFLAREEAFFQVSLPGNYPVDLLKRYPWMAAGEPPKGNEPPAGWRISFSPSGIPLRVERLKDPVPAVTVVMAKPTELPLNYLTHGLITGKGVAAALTDRGQRLLSLLTFVPQSMEPSLVAGGAAPAPPLPLPIAQRTHTVKKGENLVTIAKAYKVGAAELGNANKIKDPKLLQIGQVLVIPGTKVEVLKESAGEQGGE
ncbi:MAG: LysM peptidoglycan-binding domain-containing protein, partial [Verrucomicrobiaceae bacterium]